MAVDLQMPASGWRASLEMGFKARGRRTVVERLVHSGPLRIQRPFYPEGDVAHVYVLHPPGGVVGGDELEISVSVDAGAHALLTTPGSTKFYRSAGDPARMNQCLKIEEGGTLEWFPHENILFPGAIVDTGIEISLTGNAGFMGWDMTCLGRPSNKERFESGRLDANLKLSRDGQTVLIEKQRVYDLEGLDAPTGMRGYHLLGVFLATPCTEAQLNQVQDLIRQQGSEFPVAATLLDGLLVVRALGNQTEALQKVFIPVWQMLRPLMFGREAVVPRIWLT